LTRLRRLLAPENLTHEVDARIDRAVARFAAAACGPVTGAQFHELIAAFVQHIYEHGLRLPRRLAAADALTEALALIEEAYPVRHDDRYDAAFIDATASDVDGPERVLLVLAEAIKRRERHAHMLWLIVTTLDPTDRRARRALVDLLRHEAPHLFCAGLADLSTPQLAGRLLMLLGCELELDDHEAATLGWLGG